MSKQWIAELKEGDEVIVDTSRYGAVAQEVARVSRVTRTQVKVAHWVFERETGRERGGSDWNPARLVEPTPENVQRVKEVEMSTRKLVVKRLEDDEVVREIPVSGSDRQVERTLMGLLRNMDTERFYVDDSQAFSSKNDDE